MGHAIELLNNLSHGEAISIGMVKELELANRLGISSKEEITNLKNALKANNLPTDFPAGFNPKKAFEVMKYDKKGKFIFAFDAKNYNRDVNEETIWESLAN